MIEKIKILRDNKKFCASIRTDLSKAFDCIPYDLLIAKLNAYGFDQEALKRIYSYVFYRPQNVKVGFSFSKELDILCGVPQRSIFGPLLVTTDICDLFFIDMSSDIASYTDDIILYECAPYYNKLKEIWNCKFTKYLIGSSIIISKLTLPYITFHIALSVCYHKYQ